jgi:hypothetical protein
MTRRLLLLLVLSLLAVGAAQAHAAVKIETSAAPFEPTAELSEEGEAEEECFEAPEEDGEEATEGDEECEEADGSEASSAESCPLRSAHAHAATQHDTLKVTIGYTTNEPVAAKIQLRASGSAPKTFKRHLSRSGILRFSEALGGSRNPKVTVLIEPVGRAGCPSRRLVLFRH